MAGRLVESRRAESERRGLGLRIELERAWAAGHPHLAEHLVANLIDNALRHTPPGGTVQLSARERGRAEIVFEVRDTGAGVAAEDLPHLFTRFYRGDKARGRFQESGSGIGLTIARHYVETQGGHLEVLQEPGWGGVFSFSVARLGGHPYTG